MLDVINTYRGPHRGLRVELHSIGGAQYVALQKIFLTSKFSYLLLFSNATHKTKIGTANRWETTHSNRVKLSRQWTTSVRLCSALYQPHSKHGQSLSCQNSELNFRLFKTYTLAKVLGTSHFRATRGDALTMLRQVGTQKKLFYF